MYKRVLQIGILLLALGATPVSAQSFLKKLGKEVEKSVNKAIDEKLNGKKSKQQSTSKRQRPAANKQQRQQPAEAKQVALTAPPQSGNALFEPRRYPTDNGTVGTPFTPLPQKSESSQRQWVNKQPAPAKLTNKRLIEECDALGKWMETVGKNITITDALATRHYNLNNEITARVKILNTFVERLHRAQETKAKAEWAIRQDIAQFATMVLDNDDYKRTIQSSLAPLKGKFSPDLLAYFEQHGGVENAHSAPKTKWEPCEPLIVRTSVEGLNGVVPLGEGPVDVAGIEYTIQPRRVFISRTHAGQLAGKDIVIPSHIEKDGEMHPVTEVGEFYGSAFKSITIPNTVQKIASNGFANLQQATSITLPNSVKELTVACFHSSWELSEVFVPNSVTRIGGGCFANCPKLTKVTLPKEVKHFDVEQFDNCPSLVSVNLPENLKKIPANTFRGCKSLPSIVIPPTVTVIEGGAFDGCAKLKAVEIPASVTEIGGGAFAGCSSLTSIVIPPTVTEIAWGAFEGCKSLKSVTLSSKFKDVMQLSLIFGTELVPRDKNVIPAIFHFVD